MDNQKLFLYAALAFVGLLIWQQWQADFGPQPQFVTESTLSQSSQLQQGSQIAPDETLDIPNSADSISNNNQNSNVEVTPKVVTTGAVITVETDNFIAKINTKGGVISSIKLRQYPLEVNNTDELLELVHDNEDSLYVIQSGLRSKTSPAPTHHDIYRASSESFKMDSSQSTLIVPLTWEKEGVKVTKQYSFNRDSYLINVKHIVENNSGQSWLGSQYRQITRARPIEESKFLYTYTGAVVYNEEIKYEKVDFDDMEDESFRLKTSDGWVAMIQHYFLSSWIPNQQENNLFYSLINLKTYPATYTIGIRSDNNEINANSSYEFNSDLFVGPKLTHQLEAVATGLDLTVDYGYLTVISKPLYWLLETIHEYVGNWGFAIILLTVLIKGGFYKLSEKSYRSMARMRKVAPRLKTLKERYGEDRQKMNQAMMELYKKEKINPLSGCLPVLIQIPVFIALYWALLESVELRQAPFILWIEDLSTKDPYFVLPLIMGVSMFIQQKLNPAPPDPVQAKIMMFLPVVFTVFFAFFPSGLVLYWVVNNILSITQQYFITKGIEAEK